MRNLESHIAPVIGTIFLLASAGTAPAQVEEAWVARFDEAGSVDVEVGPGGNVYVLGSVTVGENNDNAILLLKYDSDGTLLWSREWSPTDDRHQAAALQVDQEGNIVVLAETWNPEGERRVALGKYGADGEPLWDRTWATGGNAVINGGTDALVLDSSGNPIVCGEVGPPFGHADAFTLKYDSEGDFLWSRTVARGEVDRALGVCVDEDDVVYTTGWSHSSTAEDVFLVKYSPSGSRAFLRFYSDEGHSVDYGNAVTIDAGGNILITGTTSNQQTGRQLLVLKYDASGTLQWAQQYNGPGGGTGTEVGLAIVADADGNAYVAGSTRPEIYGDFTTLSFDAAGALRWVREIRDRGGRAVDIELGLDGAVCVTGTVYSKAEITRMETRKYDPSDGSTRWAMTYTGSGMDARSNALALGTDDNVYITGSSEWAEGVDATTIKYAHAEDACPADVDGDGVVDFEDLVAVLAAWGNEGGPEDIDGSGTVDFGDLLIVLDSWGPCN